MTSTTAGESSLSIPFVTTSVADDLRLGMIALPIWWILGVEQFIWLPLGMLIFLKYTAAHGRFPPMPDFAGFGLAFLCFQLVSAVFIEEGYRVVTFARNWLTYLGAFLWLLMASVVAVDPRNARRLLEAVTFGLVGAGVLGLLGMTGIWRPEFESPWRFVLPGGIQSTGYGSQIIGRNFGSPAWFIGIGQYFRLESVFTFATLFAFAIVIVIPVALWLRRTSLSRRQRWAWSATVGLLIVNLIGTTGRASALALVSTGTLLYVMRRPRVFVVGLALAMLGVFAVLGTASGRESVRTAVLAVTFARGAGSPSARAGIYQATVEGIKERPWFGWGTERDVPGLRFPAGSHSYYLGMVYKHGIFAFTSLVLCMAAIGRRMLRLARETVDNHGDVVGSLYGLWILLIVVVNGITDVIDLDAITVTIAWTCLSIFASIQSEEFPVLRRQGSAA